MRTPGTVAVLAVGLLVGTPSHALTVTLDDQYQTVARPDSGTVEVKFFGSVSLGAGENFFGYSFSPPFLANSFTGLLPGSLCASGACSGGYGELFSLLVRPTDALGRYGFAADDATPAYFGVFGLDAAGNPLNARTDYSVDVVGSVVPLPAAAWLLLSGLGGLGFMGRRRKVA